MSAERCLAMLFIFFFAAQGLAKDSTPSTANAHCILVEYWMFSGVGRPAYRICGETEIKSSLQMLERASSGHKMAEEEPRLESTPAYQGLSLMVPVEGSRKSRRIFLGNGRLWKEGMSFDDEDRAIEKHFLEGGRSKPDIAGNRAGETLPEIIDAILVEIENTRK